MQHPFILQTTQSLIVAQVRGHSSFWCHFFHNPSHPLSSGNGNKCQNDLVAADPSKSAPLFMKIRIPEWGPPPSPIRVDHFQAAAGTAHPGAARTFGAQSRYHLAPLERHRAGPNKNKFRLWSIVCLRIYIYIIYIYIYTETPETTRGILFSLEEEVEPVLEAMEQVLR